MSLHVRSLTITEGKKIQRLLRHSKSRVVVRRAQVILLSDQGMLAEKIAQVTLMHHRLEFLSIMCVAVRAIFKFTNVMLKEFMEVNAQRNFLFPIRNLQRNQSGRHPLNTKN